MLALAWEGVERVLCLGAHSDDIEIGCGGTLATLLEMRRGEIAVDWVVFGAVEARAREAEASAQALVGAAKESNVIVRSYRESYFPYAAEAIKEDFDELGREATPDVVFSHWRGDAHQDHRCIAELTWNTFRDHLILEYEIPKYDADLGHPNAFVPLEKSVCDRKVAHLLEAFPSQRHRDWFSDETFRALLRLRGIECRSTTGYAEAFHCRKFVVGRP